MATGTELVSEVQSVRWHANIRDFDSSGTSKDALAGAVTRIARWARQLETADSGNSAITFIRECQVQVHYSAALIPLAMYKPAATAARAAFESALYYTYFRSHPIELDTLTRESNYFIDKTEILDFHKIHTPDYANRQNALALGSKIKTWYADVSAVVHGQIPGLWSTHTRLRDIGFNLDVMQRAVSIFTDGEEIIHRLLLTTLPRSVWDAFTVDAKRRLLSGMSANARAALGLAGM